MARFIVKSEAIREMLSEFAGTLILVIFCIAGPLNLKLIKNHNSFFGDVTCAAGIYLGVTTALSNSGAHLNPIVTTSFAARGLFPWRKVPHYIAAQYLGAFIAAAVVYLNFAEGISELDGGVRVFSGNENATGTFFATYPNENVSFLTCIFDTMLCSSLLLFAVAAITDHHNSTIPIYLWAPCIAFMVLGIASSFSYNCSVAMNPARDLGPRIFTVLAGYGVDGFKAKNNVYWLMATVVPHVGGLIGIQFYHFAIGLQKPGEEERLAQIQASNIKSSSLNS